MFSKSSMAADGVVTDVTRVLAGAKLTITGRPSKAPSDARGRQEHLSFRPSRGHLGPWDPDLGPGPRYLDGRCCRGSRTWTTRTDRPGMDCSIIPIGRCELGPWCQWPQQRALVAKP